MCMGDVYGRCVWEMYIGDVYGRCVWEMCMAYRTVCVVELSDE